MTILSFFSFLLLLQTLTSSQFVSNPCPNYFKYERDADGVFGLIEVPPIQLGQSLKLNVELSVGARILNNYYGSLELVGSKEGALKKVLQGQNIQYRVSFPVQEPLAKLIKIVYNGQEICSGPSDQPSFQQAVTTVKLEHTFVTFSQQNGQVVPTNALHGRNLQTFIQGPDSQLIPVPMNHDTINNVPNIQWIDNNGDQTIRPFTKTNTTPKPVTLPSRVQIPDRPVVNNNDDCGIATLAGNPLIYNGSPTTRGEFPWLVVIYVKKTRGLEFQCGGTLISDQVILTAAHCIHLTSDDILSKNEIVLHVGRFDIDDWTEGEYILPKVKNIFVHPDYKRYSQTSFDADIAVIVLRQSITFTQFIRPVCLWHGKSPTASQSGIVVGWGRDETGVPTSKPNQIEMPVVSNATCLESEPTYQYLTSNRTFCAGRRDGSGPCNGDSGGGFLMKNNGKWYLRGIVSTSLYDKETKSCDVRNFSVFTDVAKFLQWIHLYL
ncbi:serine protease gd-like [Culicoides brevitarsis]|uniref:serine protease gd-like n=1 Tax=Culicoides brevitarsis TaxID=469753 RepID=UPI00307C3F79